MSAIPFRKLGRSGIEVSPMGMGCWAIGGPWFWLGGPGGWGEVDDNESLLAIHVALDNGINFFDTAANYGAGHSEHILGQALKGHRQKAIIATKFGFVVDKAGKSVTRFEHDEDVIKDARISCENSLRRLGTDYIDLFQLHVWDYPAGPAIVVREALEGLVREGKIRAYGWSTDDPQLAQIFAEGEHCAAVQHDLNVVMDAAEMIELCERENLASVNRSPLARGALTGKYSKDALFPENDVRTDDWSSEHFFKPTLEKLDELRSILTSDGRTLAQGALAWVLTRSQRTIPIPGIRTMKQAKENASTIQLGLLSPGQMKQIEEVIGRVEVST
jgi:aryl-alcohol dehydrogenase-like predicted oxidoreductase